MGKGKGKNKGKSKGVDFDALAREQEARIEAEVRARVEAEVAGQRAGAEVDSVSEDMTPEERKAAKRKGKAKHWAEQPPTAETVEVTPKAKGKHKGKAKAVGETVSATPVPDIADTEGVKTPSAAELAELAAAMDPGVSTVEPEVIAPGVTKPDPEPVERDQWDRPLIAAPDGVTFEGQRGVKTLDGRPAIGYRRVTTFIDVLSDKSSLKDWAKRNVLEGALLDYREPHSEKHPSLINRVGTVLDARDTTLADIARQEATGPLILTPAKEAALKAFKDGLDALAEEAEAKAGAHDKRQKGTDLHALTELVDQGLPLPEGTSATDRRDLEAYSRAVKAAGLVFTERERFVVLDDLQVGGTLDRAGLFKFSGTARARRCVIDIKTGSIEYDPGKFAMQLATYAHGKAYDKTTRERTDLKLDKTRGLLIHLPAGEGRCDIFEVDIAAAWSEAVQLAQRVYDWRAAGKKVLNRSAPVVSIKVESTEVAA